MSSAIKVLIDLNFQFKGPDGKPIMSGGDLLKPANEIVGNFLYNTFSQDKSDKLRNREWAQQLYKTGTIELDKRSIEAILEVCVRGNMADGVYCELMDYLDGRKEEWQKLHEESKKQS